jgi:hypothetical protein
VIATLIILACAAGICRDYPAELPPGAGLMACVTLSQQIAAAWAAEHPSFTVQGVRCQFSVPERGT